jgi:PAS domain S-box-containing protein
MQPFPQVTSVFEALAESAADAIFTIDERSVIQFANAATVRVFGYEPQELVGRPLYDLIPERFRAAHAEGIRRYLSTGRRNIPWTGVQLPGLRKDGTEVPLEISFGEFVQDDGRRLFSGFMRDISERVRQAEALERARAASEQALHEVEAVGRIMDLALAAPSYARMVDELLRGLRRELQADEATVMLVDEERRELLVQQTDGIRLDHSLRIPIGSGITGVVAETGQPVVLDDTRNAPLLHAPLREQIASLVVVPMRTGGELVGVLHVGTRQPRHFSEADVRLLETVGARMAGVMARTRQYQFTERRRERAEASVRSRDEVLSVVAHDLRNPVSTVLMSAALLNDRGITLDEAQVRKQLEVIERAARRMNRMIEDLHDVARIEGGRFTLTCRCESPSALASEAYESFRPQAAERSLTLECRVPASPPLPGVYADRDRVVQALANYLHNAIKFTAPGGRVVLSAEQTAEGGVRYTVSDTGPGIPADEVANVFERFWQGKRTAHMGSGLGLAIVKGIALAHGGRVGVDTGEAGSGSSFWIELPHSRECD